MESDSQGNSYANNPYDNNNLFKGQVNSLQENSLNIQQYNHKTISRYKCQKQLSEIAPTELYYIKESFSPDGRVLCSPYGNETRLLTFSEECHEFVNQQAPNLKEMNQVCSTSQHDKVVISTKFSPQGHLLLTGCFGGKIKFHQPIF